MEKDGKTANKSLEDSTVEEIHAATRKHQRAENKTPVKASPVVKALTKELQTAKLRGITVRFAGGQVSFGGDPIEAFADFVKGRARAQLPGSAG